MRNRDIWLPDLRHSMQLDPPPESRPASKGTDRGVFSFLLPKLGLSAGPGEKATSLLLGSLTFDGPTN
jgi:hypothetical protein